MGAEGTTCYSNERIEAELYCDCDVGDITFFAFTWLIQSLELGSGGFS